MRVMRLLQLRVRLRRLQRLYYRGGPGEQDALAAQYIQTLAEARSLSVPATPPGASLHLGSGGHRLRQFVNVDRDIAEPIDVVADLAAGLPFLDASVAFIHTEDFIEHIDLAVGKRFIAEARRVLKSGGVMRILTPDLRAIAQRVYFDRERSHLRWCDSYLDAQGPAEAFNMHMRMNGEHRFLYDEELLTRLLESVGFRVRRVRFNWSPEPWLRYLDLRDFGLNLFLEAVADPS